MSFIEDFYLGNITPCEGRFNNDPQYANILRETEESQNRLLEALSEDDSKLFHEFTESRNALSAISHMDSFTSGFRLGVQMMVDCFKFEM